eukprot:s1014_g8.t1
MYTSLCVHFNDWCSEHLKVGKFKHVLLDQCQASFEANLSDPPKDSAVHTSGLVLWVWGPAERLVLRIAPQEMSPKKKAAATPEELEEHEEKRQRYRLRVMGNIRFIGQLLVKKMVASKILTACTTALLKEASQSSLEALASLLTITGKDFDLPTWQPGSYREFREICPFSASDLGEFEEMNQPSSSTTGPPQRGETPLAAPDLPPAPHDLCKGGLADLAAERRAAMLKKLFPPQEPSEA